MSTVFLPLAKMAAERYFNRMITIHDILALIDEHERRTGETMTELARRAIGKKDTIRNWRRSVADGVDGSASFQNVQAILGAIGVEVKLGDTRSPIRSGDEVIEALKRIEGLDERGVEVAFSVISSHLRATTGQLPKPSQVDAGDQSESPSSRREASSSR
jgi:hypothetical protein